VQRDLVLRPKRGDHEAFTALIAASVDRLHAAARLILRNQDAAEDAVQDALVRAWVGLRGLRDPERFEAWLHRLLVHGCYRAARRRRSRELTELTEVAMPPGQEPSAPDVQGSVAIHAFGPSRTTAPIAARDSRSAPSTMRGRYSMASVSARPPCPASANREIAASTTGRLQPSQPGGCSARSPEIADRSAARGYQRRSVARSPSCESPRAVRIGLSLRAPAIRSRRRATPSARGHR